MTSGRFLSAALSARAVSALLTLLALPPAALSYRLASFGAALLTPPVALFDALRGRDRTSIRRNLRIAFGADLSRLKILLFTYGLLRHIAHSLLDLARLPKFRAAELAATVSERDGRLLRGLAASGRGLILVSGHVGAFEMQGAVAPLSGVPMTTVANDPANPELARLLRERRQCHGQVVLENRRVLFHLKEVLKAGGVVGLLADENTKRKPVFVPFFGTLASSNRSIANLARLLDVPLLVGAIHRVGAGRYRLVFRDLIEPDKAAPRDEDERRIITRINAGIERAVRASPRQYLWNMRRWRNRPPDEQVGADGLPPRVAPARPPSIGELLTDRLLEVDAGDLPAPADLDAAAQRFTPDGSPAQGA